MAVSDKTLAKRLREKNEADVLAAFELQKTYNRLVRRRGCKNPDTFIASVNYPYFIKLIRFARDVKMPDIELYLKVMIKNDVKPGGWTHDRSYRLFLQKMDSVDEAIHSISVSAKELQDLAEKLDIGTEELFRLMTISEILQMVRQRRLSPWLLMQSKAFKNKLISADANMQDVSAKLIDPTYWTITMNQNNRAVLLAKQVCKQLGI